MKHPKVDVPVIPSYSPLQISDHISYRIRKKGVFYMKYTAKTDLTKRALSDSLKKLVLNRPISKITIKDITDGCGLNRQTFYYHFQDIFDLFEWTFNAEMETVIAEVDIENARWDDLMKSFLSYLKENEYTCRCIIDGFGREQLISCLHDNIYTVIRKIIDRGSGKDKYGDFDKKHIDFAAHLFTYAFGHYIFDWIKNGAIQTPDEIVDLFRFIVEHYISPR